MLTCKEINLTSVQIFCLGTVKIAMATLWQIPVLFQSCASLLITRYTFEKLQECHRSKMKNKIQPGSDILKVLFLKRTLANTLTESMICNRYFVACSFKISWVNS